MENLLETYNDVKECHYKNEHYSVRDNGAALRHSPINKRTRPTDNNWTFGKINIKTGYREIASVRVHRIIATAFHGEPPTNEHVVDHIDTNKQNNRPDNLRWVTRLENILLNPITARRVEIVCGSVEAFLIDPSKYRDKFPDPNYNWMCAVSIEEAQESMRRLLAWAKSDKHPSGGSLGDWVYNRSLPNLDIKDTPVITTSLTLNAVQKNWITPSLFQSCPKNISNNSINEYFTNLEKEKVFAQNQYSSSIIEDFAISKDKNTLWVMCRSSDTNAIKSYSLAEVTFENSLYVHNSLGSFFMKDGAEKQFTLAQGLEWTRGETFDDLC